MLMLTPKGDLLGRPWYLGDGVVERLIAEEGRIHLYILQDEIGRVKIGRSSAIKTRVRQISNSSGLKIHIVATFGRLGSIERELHKILARHRLRGEWFKDTVTFRDRLIRELGPMEFPLPPVG